MTNSGGASSSYSYASHESQWRAFERLPRSVRDALNEAAFAWAPYPIWRSWEAGRFKDAKALVKEIRRWDRQAIARREKRRRK
jgi:uncharacterized protein DUF6525